MIEVATVEQIVSEYLTQSQDEGLFISNIEVSPSSRIVVEIDHDTRGISIEECMSLSRYIESHLSREDEDYELEVASRGLTSPLLTVRQYRKFVGKELEVLLSTGVKERGELLEVREDGILLRVTRMIKPEGGKRKKPTAVDLEIRYDEVKKATYMIAF